MTEVRTTSKTGGQKGVKPQRYDLLPKEGLDAIAELFGYGAHKYADHNWRNGYEFSKSISALERHTQAFKNGETFDYCPDTCPMIDDEICQEHSRLEHLAAVGFHTLVLLTWLRREGEGLDNDFDDRWPHSLERARRKNLEEQDELISWKSPQTLAGKGRNRPPSSGCTDCGNAAAHAAGCRRLSPETRIVPYDLTSEIREQIQRSINKMHETVRIDGHIR